MAKKTFKTFNERAMHTLLRRVVWLFLTSPPSCPSVITTSFSILDLLVLELEFDCVVTVQNNFLDVKFLSLLNFFIHFCGIILVYKSEHSFIAIYTAHIANRFEFLYPPKRQLLFRKNKHSWKTRVEKIVNAICTYFLHLICSLFFLYENWTKINFLSDMKEKKKIR